MQVVDPSRNSWGSRKTSYTGHFNQSRRSRVEVVPSDRYKSIIKVTEHSACFGRGGVTAFTERRVTRVLNHDKVRRIYKPMMNLNAAAFVYHDIAKYDEHIQRTKCLNV